MKKLMIGMAMAFWAMANCIAQDSLAIKYAGSITAEELKEHLMILASDEYEGRDTGSKGQKKAAKYIADYFESLGIAPLDNGGYFQEFGLYKEKIGSASLEFNDLSYKFPEEFFFLPGYAEGSFEFESVVFIGYGIDSENYSDYDGVDVNGKAVVFFSGEPKDKRGNSLISGTEELSDWADDFQRKRELAIEKGASVIFHVREDFQLYLSRLKWYLNNPRTGLKKDDEKKLDGKTSTFIISPETANNLLKESKLKSIDSWRKKVSKKGKAWSQELKISGSAVAEMHRDQGSSENVLAYIEGSDLKEELIVITAHYDHVGKDGEDIYNGADDDGSGTVTALELAEAFQEAKKNGHGSRRSILIMTVSGEEKGLLGSEWYTDHPVFPLEQTVANLNIDMIGRTDEAHSEDPNYIYLIGSDRLSTQLHEISENANRTYTELYLDYTYNDPNDPNRFYYRSDHYNFAKNGIPVIFYFSGVHEDYHQPTDTPEKIMYEKMVPIARLVFHTAWELANREKRIVVDVPQEGLSE